MNKEITIIELLNKIANGEKLPQKIKYENVVYEYEDLDKEYQNKDGDDFFAFTYVPYHLYDKVEIIEEDKDIEEIKIDGDFGGKYITNEQGDNCYIKSHDETMINKLNEVIREVNKLRKEVK